MERESILIPMSEEKLSFTSFNRSLLSLVSSSCPVGISSNSSSSLPSPTYSHVSQNHLIYTSYPPMRNQPSVSNCLTVSGLSFNWFASSITLLQLPGITRVWNKKVHRSNLLLWLFQSRSPALHLVVSPGKTFSLQSHCQWIEVYWGSLAGASRVVDDLRSNSIGAA